MKETYGYINFNKSHLSSKIWVFVGFLEIRLQSRLPTQLPSDDAPFQWHHEDQEVHVESCV